MKCYEKLFQTRIIACNFGMKSSFENMGRICFYLDDNFEQILRRESQNSDIPLSEFIRKKLFSPADSKQQKILSIVKIFST